VPIATRATREVSPVRVLFGILRIAIAALVVAAMIGQLVISTQNWNAAGATNFAVLYTNFFSFFTIDSNVLTVVIGLIGAWVLFARKGADPAWFLGLRLATVTYMATTGIVYNLLLRGIALPQGQTLPWSNEVLHVIAPAYIVLDWLLAPGRRTLAWKAIWPVLIFPLVWGVYTLIRGPLVIDEVKHASYWYPYPFLNPNNSPEGYFSVAFYIVLIAAIIGLVCAGAIWVSRRRLPSFSRE
jgi:hypothetical protein